MNEKKVLYIISEFFAPNQNVGAIKFTKIVKYLLQKEKYEIYVFTRKNMPKNDELLESDLRQIEKLGGVVYTIDAGKEYYQKSKIKRIVRKYKKKFIKPNESKEYVKKNSKEMKLFVKNGMKLLNAIDIPAPDYMISTYDDFGGHKFAEKIKDLYGNRVYWVTDFRDQVAIFFKDDKTRLWADNYSEFITSKSDFTTASSSVAKNMVLAEEVKFQNIHIGFDYEDVEKVRKLADSFNITYSGSYYGDRTIKPLLQVIWELDAEGKVDKNNFVINYCGIYGNDLKKELKEFGMDNALIDWGTLSHIQAMLIQNRSDVLLTCVWNYPDYQGVIGGKTFEYIGLGKPIIAIVKGTLPNSDMKKLIDGGECGFCYEEANHKEDIVLLKEKIYQYYTEKQKEGFIQHTNNYDFIKKYDLLNIAEEYDLILENGV